VQQHVLQRANLLCIQNSFRENLALCGIRVFPSFRSEVDKIVCKHFLFSLTKRIVSSLQDWFKVMDIQRCGVVYLPKQGGGYFLLVKLTIVNRFL